MTLQDRLHSLAHAFATGSETRRDLHASADRIDALETMLRRFLDDSLPTGRMREAVELRDEIRRLLGLSAPLYVSPQERT